MSSNVKFRQALRGDLEAMVALFADDKLGRKREDPSLPLNQKYIDAFNRIETDQNQVLLVAEADGRLSGVLQITFIPYLSRMGSIRSVVESVRVAADLRGRGIGTMMMQEAIRICRQRGCDIVQLTTDRQRENTRSFYESLGFEATHDGMKLFL